LSCYTFETGVTASTVTVTAGSTINVQANSPMYHNGVINLYMAKAPGAVSSWDGGGNVWFKVYTESVAVIDGSSIITFSGTSKLYLP
jgi:hypothetical protein